MTNKQAIKLLKNRKKICTEYRRASKAWTKADRRESKARKQYEIIYRVTEIFEGKALCVHGVIGDLAVDALWTERRAELYKNARTKRTWGLRVYALTRVQTMEEVFCGSGWRRKQDALEAAKRFVAFGKMPKMDGRTE
jgi:hypothetical protein